MPPTQSDPISPSSARERFTVPPNPEFVQATNFCYINHELNDHGFRDTEWCVGSIFLINDAGCGLAVVLPKADVVKLGAIPKGTKEGDAFRAEQAENMQVCALSAATEFSGQLVVPISFAYQMLADMLKEYVGEEVPKAGLDFLRGPPLSEN